MTPQYIERKMQVKKKVYKIKSQNKKRKHHIILNTKNIDIYLYIEIKYKGARRQVQ